MATALIIGVIASFIIHSKINNFRYISYIYYHTLCKKGHAPLAENDKKLKPHLFLNFRCGHSVRTFCFHVCCSHSHWASLSTLPRKRSLPDSRTPGSSFFKSYTCQ